MQMQSVASMPIDALIKMRKDIDEELKARVDQTRKQLDELQRTLQQSESAVESTKEGRRKPAAKYIGPYGETWTGRGLKPRWLQALIKEGHAIEKFAIPGAGQIARKRQVRSRR